MFCIAVTWLLGPMGSRKYLMVWMGGLTPERFYWSFYWYLVGLSNQIPLPLLQCPGQELLYLIIQTIVSFSQLLSVRQLGRRHQDRKNQLWLMLSCYIPWSIRPFISPIFCHSLLESFCILCPCIPLFLHLYVPVHMYQNFTSQIQPWNSPSLSLHLHCQLWKVHLWQ